MRSFLSLSALTALLATSAIAAPAQRMERVKREHEGDMSGSYDSSSNSTSGSSGSMDSNIDGVILNYALTLEHLEANFYKMGLEKYSAQDFMDAGYPEWVRLRLSEIGHHENEHVDFLTAALKAANVTPVEACEYAFPDNSPASMLAVAQILEGVGVSAYLGAAAKITNKDYVTAAGSILTVEARHSAWIRSGAQSEDGFPEAFDTPLDFNEVYSLAAPFFKSCPESNPSLPVMAFPSLSVEESGPYMNGQHISVKFDGNMQNAYCQFLWAGGPTAQPIKDGKCMIPEKPKGQVYLVATNGTMAPSDDNTLAGPAVIEIPLQATLF